MRRSARLLGAGLCLGLLATAILMTKHTTMPPTASRPSNRLIHEKSPYLLQHAYNPVDWYPWGEEAFAKAQREDKPIFLSVGYSTCYWCHVMEQESFENTEIARLLNAAFVPVKVDREERPDIDSLYMAAVQAMSGQGGWPMTVFLTPDGQPFWGGTYFPPEERWGRPGLPTVLRSMQEAWRTKRDELLRSGRELTQALQAHPGPTGEALTPATLEQAVLQIGQQFDPTHGGFGPAPKFPRSHTLSLLLRSWYRTRDAHTLTMVEQTLQAMAHGGIRDHLGGGFHRYATDEEWLVPHFEKMLYDQALLARAYLEAYQATAQAADADVAREIFEYVLRDLHDAAGGFYAAEDAGEVGQEGEFYVWTAEEIAALLTPEEAALCRAVYGVTPGGNFEGRTILHIAQPLDAAAQTMRLGPDAAGAFLASAKAKLFAARRHRPRPHRDDKILTDWNGLMIGALAYGGAALDEPRYTEAAIAAARFLLARVQRDGQLLHRYRDGEAAIPGYLDDYAFLTWGLLELYETTFDPTWLAQAQRLTREMVERFWDADGGGFFFSGTHNERLIAQTKEVYDGAVPSGNSVAALVLVRLGQFTMDGDLQQRAAQLIQAFAGQVQQAPHAFPQFLVAVDAWLGPSQEIVIAGDPSAPETRAMVRAVQGRFLPRTVVLLHPSEPRSAAAIEALAPFLKEQRALEGRATAYVCENYTCNLPTTNPAAVTSLLEAAR